jgi:hypothetical protein
VHPRTHFANIYQLEKVTIEVTLHAGLFEVGIHDPWRASSDEEAIQSFLLDEFLDGCKSIRRASVTQSVADRHAGETLGFLR